MIEWLRAMWHFNDEICFAHDIAMSKEESERRLTELMKLNGNAGLRSPHVAGFRASPKSFRKYPRPTER